MRQEPASLSRDEQGKIERYRCSIKNVMKLEHAIGQFVEHCNHPRYYESLSNVTPADVYLGRGQEILARRAKIKRQTMMQRKWYDQELNPV
ncbi:MAG: hypothetical protein R8K46_06495 [Mariprofundaceae bacterium]